MFWSTLKCFSLCFLTNIIMKGFHFKPLTVSEPEVAWFPKSWIRFEFQTFFVSFFCQHGWLLFLGLVQTAESSVCFSHQIFNTDCPRSDLLCPGIIALYPPICMSYHGNDLFVSTGDAASQHTSTTNGEMLIRHQTLGLRVAVPNSVATDRLDRTAQWRLWCSVLQSWWASLCSERFGAVCKAVTDGSMSSLRHLMMRGGWQIFECAMGRLSGSVVLQHPIMSVKTLHSGAQYPQRVTDALDWRSICTNQIEIAFQTTSPCGLDLVCKNQNSCGLLLSTLPEVNLDSVWICQKSGLGWQCEHGPRQSNLVCDHWFYALMTH